MVAGALTFQTISQIFTTSTFKKIVREEDIDQFHRCISRSENFLKIKVGATNLDVIKQAYDFLNKNYRNEYLYKNALFKLLLKEKKLSNTIVLNELRINQSIADTVFINGEAVLYEIKTELDTPDKLIGQIADYKKAFGKICVVTHSSNFYRYYQLIKGKGIGLTVFNDKSELIEHTRPQNMTDDFDHTTLFKLLRKSEYSSLIENRFGYLPGVPNTLYFRKCLELAKTLPVIELQRLVMNELKKRSLQESKCIKKIPSELQYICYTLKLKDKEYLHLSNFLNVTFKP